MLFLLALLACCCWWYLPLLLGWRREEAASEPDEAGFLPLADPVAPPPAGGPGKWAQVDTSKYIWAKDGGSARPMPVKWGNLGATTAGSHLESETKIITEQSPYGYPGSIQEEEDESCCESCMYRLQYYFGYCLACCKEAFDKCKNARPYRGDFK